MGRIRIKWMYDKPSPIDGYRILVEPYIPPKKIAGRIFYDEWKPSVSPPLLYKFNLNNNPEFYREFEVYYSGLLQQRIDDLKSIVDLAYKQNVTLLYDSIDQKKNHAIILQHILSKIRNE